MYDAHLAKALSHPLRARILEALQRVTASPSDLARELAAPLGNVSYHVRILAEAGLIELVRTTRRRGATEHHYRAALERVPDAGRPRSDGARDGAADADERPLSPEAAVDPTRETAVADAGNSSASAEPLRETVREIRHHVRATARPHRGAHVTRTTLTLDDAAWQELLAAIERLQDLALRLQLESAPRLRRANHEHEREANLVLMLFEGADPAAARVLRGGVGERRRAPDGGN